MDTQIVLSWSEIDGATSYKVYSSNNPSSGFNVANNGIFDGNSWLAPINNPMMFYYVKAIKEEMRSNK